MPLRLMVFAYATYCARQKRWEGLDNPIFRVDEEERILSHILLAAKEQKSLVVVVRSVAYREVDEGDPWWPVQRLPSLSRTTQRRAWVAMT